MELQELVARARLLFNGAPKRFTVFNLVNGKRSAKEIARKSGKSLSATLQDLQKMKDYELIVSCRDSEGGVIKKENSIVCAKSPLLKHLAASYFEKPEKIPIKSKSSKSKKKQPVATSFKGVKIPNEREILDICKTGEDQLYEFKRAGCKMEVLAKEICAFANTRMGGLVFYGVEDDGAITSTDRRRQELDQSLQNSIKNNISPALIIKIIEKDVLGHKIILIHILPWNKKDVYHFRATVYIRKGTNVFGISPEESKKLHRGEYVI